MVTGSPILSFRLAIALTTALGTAACASSSSVPELPGAVVVVPSVDTRVGWVLRLEQQRILRDGPPPVVEPVTDPAASNQSAEPIGPVPAEGSAPQLPVFAPAMSADLALLVQDTDSLIRARAALAIGRVGIQDEGRELLTAALADPADGVRANAALALGLLGSPDAVPALIPLLADPSSFVVRARAVDALGLLGDRTAAGPIADASGDCPAWFASLLPDDEEYPKTPEVIEVCRAALYALVRLGDFDALARLTLEAGGNPVSHWWPLAYALQRIDDPRALPALRNMATSSGVYTKAFALRGLAAAGDAELLPEARRLVREATTDFKVRVAAVRLIARTGTAEDARMLTDVLYGEAQGSPLAIEILTALGELRAIETFNDVLDGLASDIPAVRAATFAAAARIDPDGFLFVLSGVGRDPDWTVRAALADVLARLPAEAVTPALVDLSNDSDARVHAAALRALAALKVSDLPARLSAALQADDFATRAAAAELVGETEIDGATQLLADAYARGETDTAYAARMAVVDALGRIGEGGAAVLERALGDASWPVRVRAAAVLGERGVPAEPERPAPLRRDEAFFSSDALLHPAYSPRAFIETDRGVIEVQLDLMAAPLTVATFVDQVRSGFFNGLSVHRLVPGFVMQTGDPRGDGMGGPGYTQRDELGAEPFLRGSIGMARAGFETAGSQWFITTSPQPHLDTRYTNFGRVVGGFDVLDLLAQGDMIDRVRIWDGVELR